MDNTKTKEEIQCRIQQEAKESIENNGGKGLLAMCTGVGKSRIPILYAKDKKNKIKKMAIIVPTETLRDSGWKEEFKKWKATSLYKNTDMYCYASASKIKDQEYDLVVLDEAHNITPLSSEFFQNNQVRDIIALTATLPEKEEKQEILSSLGLEVTYSLSLDQGIDLGIIAPIHIHIIYTELNSVDPDVEVKTKYVSFTQTEAKRYKYLCDVVDTQKEMRNWQSHKFAILERARFIYNLKSKEEAARDLLSILFEDRNIIFCGSVDQAERISSNTFHYKSGVENYNKFLSQEIDELVCVNKLNEGHNLPMIDNGIIIQLNSTALNLVQRIGRVCRWRDSHKANIYLFVCKGTQDEEWAKNALKDFDPKNITEYNNVKQLLDELTT